MAGITGNIYAGLHEFNDMGFLLHFLRPEDTFYDVGANVGSYTLLASSVCKAQTISFEPVPVTFNILKKNIGLNQIEHLVTLENKGVGRNNGVLKFSSDDDTTNHVIAENENADNFINVNVVSLDEYAVATTPTLIKIDVEGFETEVVNGATNLLNNPNLKAIIIELIGCGFRYGYDENEIHKKLTSLSYKPYKYNPFDRNLTEISELGNVNTIYVRDLNFVENRVKNATPFKIFNQEI